MGAICKNKMWGVGCVACWQSTEIPIPSPHAAKRLQAKKEKNRNFFKLSSQLAVTLAAKNKLGGG